MQKPPRTKTPIDKAMLKYIAMVRWFVRGDKGPTAVEYYGVLECGEADR
jgi:hypothetical protein